MQERTRTVGFSMAIIAAILWGVSGTFAQFLFEEKQLSPEWLVTVRLLAAGSILVAYSFQQKPKEFSRLLTNRADTIALLTFSVIGMLGVQYTYFEAISNSNAATATVIQYVGPVFIMVFVLLQAQRLPSKYEIVAVLLAIAGTFFLITGGDWGTMLISNSGLVWGLLSALALAFYTIYPIRLLNRYNSATIVGWGMLLGGIFFAFKSQPWHFEGIWDNSTLGAISFVVILGSLVPFYIYLNAVKMIGPSTAGLLACAEPFSAACTAVIWLQVPFGFSEWLGTLMIVGTIFVMALQPSIAPSTNA